MQLLRSPFVQPLEGPYRALLDEVARRRGWPTSAEPARLGVLVRELSRAYNEPRCAPERTPEALAARLLFSFPRDVPKGAGAVRELVASGGLSFATRRALRVLDLGAGLAATSRGIARALAAQGASGELVVHAVDNDGEALALAAHIARERPKEGGVEIVLSTERADGRGGSGTHAGPYDLIVLGQVLSELDVDAGDARVSLHADLLTRLERELAPDGAIVVVEPALRERTRHLHAVRDEVLARASELCVFAPCTHSAKCPMLVAPGDWCHEDLDVDLPDWLVPVARAAGLRWQGLTFSYLVLRRARARDTERDTRLAARLRVVSPPVVTKGKHELFLCGRHGGPEASQLRVMRLDRHRSDANRTWDQLARGDVIELVPPVDAARPRVEATTLVQRVAPVRSVLGRGLYAIVDAASLARSGLDLLAFARAVLVAAPAAIQLRAKALSSDVIASLLEELAPMCAAAGVPLVMNDRVDLAVRARCPWVHVGQEDVAVAEVRRRAPGLLVGVSTQLEPFCTAAAAIDALLPREHTSGSAAYEEVTMRAQTLHAALLGREREATRA